MRASHHLLAFDVGNTRVKAALFDGESVVASDAAVHTEPYGVAKMLQRLATRSVGPAVISTVCLPATQCLVGALQEHSIDPALILRSDGGVFDYGVIRPAIDNPESVGVDRILSSVAAMNRFPGHAVIVVDCGSAVTVNLTTADAHFQGGAILPGFNLMARCLRAGTEALPEVARTSSEPSGKDTESAIVLGIDNAIIGGIDRVVARLVHSHGLESSKVRVVLTGGDASRIAGRLSLPATVFEHLVLEGAACVYRRDVGK